GGSSSGSSSSSSSSSGSFLIKPNVGLMVWTLLLFVLSAIVLAKYVFPRISEALDRRQHVIEDSIDTAEHIRRQANELLEEYRAHGDGHREGDPQDTQRGGSAAPGRRRAGRARLQCPQSKGRGMSGRILGWRAHVAGDRD